MNLRFVELSVYKARGEESGLLLCSLYTPNYNNAFKFKWKMKKTKTKRNLPFFIFRFSMINVTAITGVDPVQKWPGH